MNDAPALEAKTLPMRAGAITLTRRELVCDGQAPVPLLPGLQVRVQQRERTVGRALLVLAVGSMAICGGGASLFSTAAGVGVAALSGGFFLGLAAYNQLRSPTLRIRREGEPDVVWPLPAGVDPDALAGLAKRAVALGQPVKRATVVFFERQPGAVPDCLLTATERPATNLPDPGDPEVLASFARATRAWEVEFSPDAMREVVTWGATHQVVFLLGETSDPVTEHRLLTFAAQLAEPPPAEAVERRIDTHDALRGRGLRGPPVGLPFVRASDITPRPPEEVAARTHALFVVSMAAQEFAATQAIRALREPLQQAWNHLTPAERSFVADPTEAQAIELGWRLECVAILSWAMGRLARAPWPNTPWSPAADAEQAAALAAKDHAACAALRPVPELADRLDRVYGAAWVARDGLLKGAPPDDLLPGAVFQQLHALRWLTGTSDWDDVRLDT